MFKLIEIIESEQIGKRVISIYDNFNQPYKTRYLERTYTVLDFLDKIPKNKEKTFFYEEEIVKKITEYKEVFYFDDNLEDIIKNEQLEIVTFIVQEYKERYKEHELVKKYLIEDKELIFFNEKMEHLQTIKVADLD